MTTMARQRGTTRKLLEGVTAGAAGAVRQFFARVPEQQANQLRRGGTPAVSRAGLPYSLSTQFGYDNIASLLHVDQDLQQRYMDYESMDGAAEVSCGLDIYADDATTPDYDREQAIWVVSEKKELADDLNDMLHNRLLVEDDIWGVVRELSLYGNVFGELLVSEQGLVGMNFLPPPTMRRVEGPRGMLLGFMQDVRGEFNITIDDFYALAQQQMQGQGQGQGQVGTSSILARRQGEITVFEDWEIVHWRLRGKRLRSIYGHAVIDPARSIWKRLALLEDALLIYKLERTPSRYAFYVDVGTLDTRRGLAYVQQVKNMHTRQKFVNPSNGKIDMRFNALGQDEDFYIPVRDGKRSTEIENIQGPDYSEVETVKYHRDKLVAALKIPLNYMGIDGEAVGASLSTADIRFARTVMRIQRVVRSGYRQGCRVHLIARGADVDRKDYDIRMNVPSQILELARVEVMSATADLASRMGEHVSTKWILTRLYKFTEEEALKVMKEKGEETLANGEIEAKVRKMEMGETVGPPSQSSGEKRLDEKLDHIDKRLAQVISAVPTYDWRRKFESTRKQDQRVEEKLGKVLKENQHLFHRLSVINGLMGDIRGSMRSVSST